MIRYLLCFSIFLIGCQRNSNQTWEDVKTAGRYVQKGFNSLWGKDSDSRQVTSEEDFLGPEEEEYIPLKDEDLKTQTTQRKKIRSEPKIPSASLPDKANFKKPTGKLEQVFRIMHFDTDDHVVREKYDLITVARMANFLKKNPNAYLLIEGHCDQRASADYNMALGTRRAHHIRVLLVKQGVNPNQVITVSYGKEKPVTFGSTLQDYSLNRRAEFKLATF